MRKLLLCVGFAAALAACGDNDLGDDAPNIDARQDDATPADAAPPDALVCSFAPGALGGACENDDQCDSATSAAGYCFAGPKLPSIFPPEGYCVLDNGGTVCDSDDDCGEGGLCLDSAGYRFCAPACCEGGACPTHQACWTSFNGFAHDRPACVPGDDTASDGDACDGFYECNEFSQCIVDFEHPGGGCERYGCTVGDDTTCHGGVCVSFTDTPFTGTLCVDACDVDTDCRNVEGYVCFDPDPVSTTDQKYCRHPHVGDPCLVAADCGTGTWECRTGTFVGGYCTQAGCPTPGTNEGCTQGSACHDLGSENICVDRCPVVGQTTGCRLGYTCADIDPGAGTVGGCLPL